MKTFIWACILSMVFFLTACGGGGGRSGECSGSAEYCAEYASSSGESASGTGTSVTPIGGFTKTGTGDTVFTLPENVTRIRIQGSYAGESSFFVVRVAGSLLVNELIGTTWPSSTFDGTYLVTGGRNLEITNSNGVNWIITQVIADASPANPTGLYAKTGTGDTVFAIPASVTKIRIQGIYLGNSSFFIVRVAGSLIVNELIGTSWPSTAFEGIYSVAGGSIVEIQKSSGVAWTFTEVP